MATILRKITKTLSGLIAQPAPAPAVVLKAAPRTVLKVFGGNKPKTVVTAEDKAVEESQNAIAAGLTRPLSPHAEMLAKWPNVAIGEKIRITNSLFPWIKHYMAGDIAQVVLISQHHDLAYEDPVKYKTHIVTIIEGPRKGQRAALFRHEFECVDRDAPLLAPATAVKF